MKKQNALMWPETEALATEITGLSWITLIMAIRARRPLCFLEWLLVIVVLLSILLGVLGTILDIRHLILHSAALTTPIFDWIGGWIWEWFGNFIGR